MTRQDGGWLAGAASTAATAVTILLLAFGSRPALAQATVSTLAGTGAAGFADGPGNAAKFDIPNGVALGKDGNLYIADRNNHVIRKVAPDGTVTTVAGTPGMQGNVNGAAATARFSLPDHIAVDSVGNIFVTETNENRIRKITAGGIVSNFAGSGLGGWVDGPGATAKFFAPTGVTVDSAGFVYVVDASNQRIRKITPAGVVSTLAGQQAPGWVDGQGSAAKFNDPFGIAVDAAGNLYVADLSNYRIRKISPSGYVTTISGTGQSGSSDGPVATAQFARPKGIALDGAGNIYAADKENIRKISTAGVVSTVAGTTVAGFADGNAATAQFSNPRSLAVHNACDIVFVGDNDNNRIRKIEGSPCLLYEYATKVACGVASAKVNTGVIAAGAYFTAINVHNPSERTNEFKWKVAVALPGEKAGTVSQFFSIALKKDEALEIDCPDVARRLGAKPEDFVKGFVVIQSNLELDVVAVYTAAASLSGTVAALEIERVPARKK